MMRKIFLLLATLTFIQASAQHSFYELNFFKQKYNYLSGGTSVNGNVAWDDDEYNITLPFQFKLFHDSSNNLHINGLIGAGAVFGIGNINAILSGSAVNLIVGSTIDLVDRDTSLAQSFSPISYIVEGTTPNRVFKLEYRNAGILVGMGNGEYSDSINMQLWLHEGTDVLEMRHGPSNYVSDPNDIYGAPGESFAILDSLTFSGSDATARKIYGTKGPSNAPVLDSLINFSAISSVPPAMLGTPADSFVYQFKPIIPFVVPFGLEELKKDYQVFKVGSVLNISIQSTPLDLSIVDMSGKLIQKYPLVQGNNRIDLLNLTRGSYLCVFSHENARDAYQIILE